jgi:hypothetical protein
MGDGDKGNRKTILLIALMVIILVAAWLLIPNIPGLIEPEVEDKPVYQQYIIIESNNSKTYKNDKLNVTLIHNNPSANFTAYEAIWISKVGNYSYAKGESLDDLFSEISRDAVSLTNDQIKWYEYMINIVLK